MFCDYQLFWHQHNQRPSLATSLTFSRDSYVEKMADDGSIKREYYSMADVTRSMSDVMQTLREHKTPTLAAFKK